MSKSSAVGNWAFNENSGKVDVLFKGVVIDTLDLPGVASLGVGAINHVLPASALPLATLIEGVVGQAMAALE